MTFRRFGADNIHDKSIHNIWIDALLGRRDDYYRVFTRFAVLTDPEVDITTDMWEHTEPELIYLPSAEPIEIVSDSAEDIAGGTGMNVMLIVGLDNDYNSINEVVLMNGLTPVTTQLSYLRIHRTLNASAGTLEANAGRISMTAQTAGTTQAIILPGVGDNRMGHFTVPAGYTAFFIDGVASCFSLKSQDVLNRAAVIETVLRFDDGRIIPGCAFGITTLGTSISRMTADFFVGWIPEKTDTKLTVCAGSTDIKITGFMTYLLIKDTEFLEDVPFV